jgi:hypothetical protein
MKLPKNWSQLFNISWSCQKIDLNYLNVSWSCQKIDHNYLNVSWSCQKINLNSLNVSWSCQKLISELTVATHNLANQHSLKCGDKMITISYWTFIQMCSQNKKTTT